MKPTPDLSGTAFSDVDGSGYPESFVSYLDEATTHFKELKSWAHSLLALRSGDRILDVGCGCGDDVRNLAAIVAPNGLAAGIDRSESMIAEACVRAHGSNLPVHFEVSDAVRLPWGSEYFDACRADRVLQHLASPLLTLREMLRVLKPGGRLLVIDRDWGMVAIDSADPATTRMVLDRASSAIRNGLIGRELYGLFRGLRVANVHVHMRGINITSFSAADSLLDLRVVARRAVEEQLLSAPAGARWLEDLVERDAEGKFFANLTLCIALGIKPAFDH